MFYINHFDYNNNNVSFIAVFLDLKKKISIINWFEQKINIFLYAIQNFIFYFQPERMWCDSFVCNHGKNRWFKNSKGNINDSNKILNTHILYIELLQSLIYIISWRQGYVKYWIMFQRFEKEILPRRNPVVLKQTQNDIDH